MGSEGWGAGRVTQDGGGGSGQGEEGRVMTTDLMFGFGCWALRWNQGEERSGTSPETGAPGPHMALSVSSLPVLLVQLTTSLLASMLFLSLLITPLDQGFCTSSVHCLTWSYVPFPAGLDCPLTTLKLLRC